MSIFTSYQNIFLHPLNKKSFLKTATKLCWWKLNSIFFHLPVLVKVADEVEIVCKPDSSYGSYIVYTKWPEFAELAFTQRILNEKSVYIDVGAHIGDSSLIAASKIKSGKVIAFEPTPDVFSELQKNIRLNNLENIIQAEQKAVSGVVGKARFALEGASEVNHLVAGKSNAKSIQVAVTTIDEVVSANKLKSVDLLKIDVEGFELMVLMGAKKALQSKVIKMILFEANPKTAFISQKLKNSENLLRSFNYSFYSFLDDGKLQKTQTLLPPSKTMNYLAVLSDQPTLKKIKPWLK